MKLHPKDIAAMLDHSTLQPFLTQEDIRKGCEVALRYHTASVCARPADMKLVASMLRGSGVKVCTVIGFPHGNHVTAIKVAEAQAGLLAELRRYAEQAPQRSDSKAQTLIAWLKKHLKPEDDWKD